MQLLLPSRQEQLWDDIGSILWKHHRNPLFAIFRHLLSRWMLLSTNSSMIKCNVGKAHATIHQQRWLTAPSCGWDLVWIKSVVEVPAERGAQNTFRNKYPSGWQFFYMFGWFYYRFYMAMAEVVVSLASHNSMSMAKGRGFPAPGTCHDILHEITTFVG